MSAGFRILPSSKKQIDLLSKLHNCSAGQVVVDLIRKSPPLPKVDGSTKIPVSYHLDQQTIAKLKQLADESCRSQSDVIDYLCQASVN